MRVSANELAVTVAKACIGRRVARGVAEDLGVACLQLALSGKPALDSILHGLNFYLPVNPDGDGYLLENSCWSIDHIAVLSNGPSAIDFALLAGADGCAKVSVVDYPDLLWGLARAADVAFSMDDSGVVTLKANTDGSGIRVGSPIGGCDADGDKWAVLCAFAHEIMVPADETNRADAGAGLTDND